MRQDEGEVGVQVAGEADLGERDVGPVGGAREGEDGAAAALDYVGGVAFKEDFADELRVGWGGGRVRAGVEGFGEREVLLCYYAAGDSLCWVV